MSVLSYDGRATRGEYFAIFLPLYIVSAAAEFLPWTPGLALASVAAVIAFVFIGLPTSVRRLHDFAKSGWWMLWAVVPLFNLALALALLFHPGTEGANRFDPVTPVHEPIG